jgi:Viral BACON domain
MHQCLRCAQPHTEISLFCGRCQTDLLNRYQRKRPIDNENPLLAHEEPRYNSELQVLKLPMRSLDSSQRGAPIDRHELPAMPEAIITPRPRYNPVVLRRLRVACIILIILTVVAFAIDSILALVVVMHRSSGTSRTNGRSHASSSVPPVIPMQLTPLQPTATARVSDEAAKSSSSADALTGQLDTSRGGGGSTLAVSSTSLSFSLIQGQNSPPGQIVTIVNTGAGTFHWLVASTSPPWLALSPLKGVVVGGQSGQIRVNIVDVGLTAGTYSTQFTITATNSADMEAQGSPQTISVVLTIFQPCTLQVFPTKLSFTGTALQLGSGTQTFSLKEVGRCAQPVTWFVKVDSATQRWLSLSSTSGSDNGSGNTITAGIDVHSLLPGHYLGQISCSAAGDGSIVEGSPQHIIVSLNVVALEGVI